MLKQRVLLIISIVIAVLSLTSISLATIVEKTELYLEYRNVMYCGVSFNEMPIGDGVFMSCTIDQMCEKIYIKNVEVILSKDDITLNNKTDGTGTFTIKNDETVAVKGKVDLFNNADGKKFGNLKITGVIDVDFKTRKAYGIYNFTFNLGRNGKLIKMFLVNYTDGEPGPNLIAYPMRGIYLNIDENPDKILTGKSAQIYSFSGTDILCPAVSCGEGFPFSQPYSPLIEQFNGEIKVAFGKVEIKLIAPLMTLQYASKKPGVWTGYFAKNRGGSRPCPSCRTEVVNGARLRLKTGQNTKNTYGYPCDPCERLPLVGDKDTYYTDDDDNDPRNDYGIVALVIAWIFNTTPENVSGLI